jgi:hypothetical protein
MIWTTSIIGGMLWLSAKFRSLETLIYTEMSKQDQHVYRIETRVQRLEFKAFGHTSLGHTADTTAPDNEATFPS